MTLNRIAIKRVNDTVTDCQVAQQLGQKVFTGQGTPEECLELTKVAEDLLESIAQWKNLIPKH